MSFILGGPVNHGPGLWNWDHKNFSPRIAVAWAPDTGDGWVSKVLGKRDQFSIRGGYSIMYDHFGIPIVNSFDQNGSFGLSTILGNPAGVVSPANAPRFTCLVPGSSGQSCLPPPCPSINDPGCLFGPVPAGGFPYTPGNTTFAINWGLDQSLKTPYTHVFNLSLARQLSSRSSLQIAYVGSIGRRLPLLERRKRLGRRQVDGRGIERGRSIQEVGRGHARKVPVHHPDAGNEPHEEEQTDHDAQPTVDEDRDSLERHVQQICRPVVRSDMCV